MTNEELAWKLRDIYQDEYKRQYEECKDMGLIPVSSIQAGCWLKVSEYVNKENK